MADAKKKKPQGKVKDGNFFYRWMDSIYKKMDKATDSALMLHPMNGEAAEIDKYLDDFDKKMRAKYPKDFERIDKEMAKRYK
jgi:transposase-like protein